MGGPPGSFGAMNSDALQGPEFAGQMAHVLLFHVYAFIPSDMLIASTSTSSNTEATDRAVVRLPAIKPTILHLHPTADGYGI